MNRLIHRMAGLIMAVIMIQGNTVSTKAAGSIYYVSPTGKDTNPGTASAPFRTFSKANSVLTPGSKLNIYAGIYNEQLKITKSGIGTALITVQPVGGTVVIDRGYAASASIDVRASHIVINRLVARNSGDVCVNLMGANIAVNGLIVYTCASHGIQINNSSFIRILNSRVFSTVLSNARRAISGGWGSAIKVRESNTVLIQGNTVYNNYGEGMGTRGINITIRGNVVYNNYSVNIYTNSENALIERNFVYCTPNSGFERNRLPAVGIGLAEEYFSGWGARLNNARVLNNIVAFCRHGVRYMGADNGVVGGGLKNAVIAYNTLYGSTNAALSIAYESGQSGSLIANNILWQAQNNLTAIDNAVGLSFQNNLWKVAPPVAFRSPGDRNGDPRFVTIPGYTSESYRPSSASPAANGAVDIGIKADYFAKSRGPAYDIGAIQFSSTYVTSNTQRLSSPTPTSTLLPATPQNTASPVPTLVQPADTLPPATPQDTATSIGPTAEPSSTAVPFTPTLVEPNSLPTAMAQPSHETRYDNQHSAFAYSAGWVEEVSPYALEGSFAQTSTNGSSVTFQFTGQSFSIIYKGGPSYRKMDLYIDGVLAATIDERHDVSTYKARWDYPGNLSPGLHTLKLVFVTTSSSTNGSLDAVIVR